MRNKGTGRGDAAGALMNYIRLLVLSGITLYILGIFNNFHFFCPGDEDSLSFLNDLKRPGKRIILVNILTKVIGDAPRIYVNIMTSLNPHPDSSSPIDMSI